MYQVNCEIVGVAPVLQHRFPMPSLADLSRGGTKSTGAKDYSDEWKASLYMDESRNLYHPSSHIEGCMIKAAASFKITGKRGKSYKDLFLGNVIVTPDRIPYEMQVPEELDLDADKPIYLDMRPVIIQRARVIRLRPALKAGWKLAFSIGVIDDQIPFEIVNEVLILAGKTIGIGDYRPKFGRFMVSRFEVEK